MDFHLQVMLGTFGYRGFFSDRQCDVLFPDGSWQPAVILRDWAEVKIPSGEKSRSYDVQGFDSMGPFHGRFTDDHVRIREAFNGTNKR
jgi:hypothetical protein